MSNLKNGKYSATKSPDARGFVTTLDIEVEGGRVKSANLDGLGDSKNPYGTNKSTSERYNNEMFDESGTYYRDAVHQINNQFESGMFQVDTISGATVISQEANDLMAEVLAHANSQ